MAKDVITSKDLSPASGLTGPARQAQINEEKIREDMRREVYEEFKAAYEKKKKEKEPKRKKK